MKRLALVIIMVMAFTSLCLADEITELKARGYEIIITVNNLQNQLAQVNQRIAELIENQKQEKLKNQQAQVKE